MYIAEIYKIIKHPRPIGRGFDFRILKKVQNTYFFFFNSLVQYGQRVAPKGTFEQQ